MIEGVIEKMERAIRGEVVDLVLSDDPYYGERSKLGSKVALGPNRYFLMAGPPGNGKTAFVDSNFVIKPYLYYRKHGGIDVSWIYRSMERSSDEKLAKWVCAILYYERGVVLSPATMFQRGNADRVLQPADIELVKEYRPFFEELARKIDIVDGATSPEEILNYAESFALTNGVKLYTEGDYAIAETVEGKEQICELDRIKDVAGVYRRYCTTRLGEVQEGKPRYVNETGKLCVHVSDHIGKVGDGTKLSIDTHSRYMADTLRDFYGYAIIDIFQMNRDFENTYRQKNQKLMIKQSDIKGSNNPVENADTILGILNPRKYDVSSYDGYLVNDMVHRGNPMFRLLFGVKNSFGTDPFVLGQYFVGECGWTKELPSPPDMTPDIYKQIETMTY